ncbi:MAG: LacI family DNA-binding transcriptional regulator [Bacteroidota bacterium]
MGNTIKDVAKLAGVSISTTSLAINNQPGVKEETKQRVLEAVKKLNYQPNRIAQGLVKNKTNNIDVIVSGPKYGYFSSPILFEVIKGIAEVVNANGYHLVLKVTTAEEEVAFLREQINSRGCDGMILWGTRMSEENFADLCQGPRPVVAVSRYLRDKPVYSVTADDLKGGYLGTKHLLDLGHRRIGFIGNLHGISSAEDRYRGFTQAMQEYGADIDRNLVISADFYQDSGYAAMREILPLYERGLSAVFAASDLMALGAIKAVIEAGLRVPGDISVVGFDNMPNADLLMVPLTTIAAPIHKLGETAAIKLLKLLRHEQVEHHTKLDVELIVRNSTGIPGRNGHRQENEAQHGR